MFKFKLMGFLIFLFTSPIEVYLKEGRSVSLRAR
jgi:hypothetical protein